MAAPFEITYIVLRFPHLTETFVAEEIQAVRQLGVKVKIFSLLPPKPAPVHPTSSVLLQYVHYIPNGYNLSMWLAQVYFLLKSPQRYFQLLWQLLRQPAPKFTWLFKRLVIFFKGVYLAYHLRNLKTQLIHTHFAWLPAAAAMIAGGLLDIPYTVTAHAYDIYSPENDLLCLTTGAARRVITISEYNKQIIAKECSQVALKHIEVLHCGIDLQRFQPALTSPDSDTIQILSVGSLVEKKGHKYLIRACRRLKDWGLKFHCTIVGQGPLQAALKALLVELELGNQVTLAGAQEQPWVYNAFRNSHIFALACVIAQNGDRDGIPVAMMESLAMGVPVVSTRVSGIPELVHHEETGLLVPSQNTKSLAAAIARLANDPALAQRLGENGRALVAQEFDIHKNGRRLADTFAGIIAGRKPE